MRTTAYLFALFLVGAIGCDTRGGGTATLDLGGDDDSSMDDDHGDDDNGCRLGSAGCECDRWGDCDRGLMCDDWGECRERHTGDDDSSGDDDDDDVAPQSFGCPDGELVCLRNTDNVPGADAWCADAGIFEATCNTHAYVVGQGAGLDYTLEPEDRMDLKVVDGKRFHCYEFPPSMLSAGNFLFTAVCDDTENGADQPLGNVTGASNENWHMLTLVCEGVLDGSTEEDLCTFLQESDRGPYDEFHFEARGTGSAITPAGRCASQSECQ